MLLSTLSDEEMEELQLAHTQLWQQAKTNIPVLINWEDMFRKITEPVTARPVHRVHFIKTAWFRVAVAIIIIFGIGAYLWQTNNSSLQEGRSSVAEASVITNDIQPGGNKAILTLSDGSKIELTNSTSETITDGTLSIANNNGQLVYESLPIPSAGGVAPGGTNSSINPSGPGAGVGSGAAGYNTMSTPRGGQYQLTLSDGTHVWLNAASSITYPTSFNSNTREISITGEAYLDVKKDINKPFIVNIKDQKIEVLGTEFNINAYSDEPATKTSLIAGKIKINNTILDPGKAYTAGKIVPSDPSCSAWKDGYFQFDKNDVPSILRQVARWYDLEIIYHGKITDDLFSGKIERSLPLKSILRLLEQGNLKFKVDGKRLIML